MKRRLFHSSAPHPLHGPLTSRYRLTYLHPPLQYRAHPPTCRTSFRPCYRSFTTSLPLHDNPTNHYEVLGVDPTISQPALKKQFYTLSKENHPDLHRTDHSGTQNRTQKFQAISESYSVLGDPEKRRRYDRDVLRLHQRRHPAPSNPDSQQGTYAGSRPASGLSKRRSAFRGPPPSYFAHGRRPPNASANNSSSQTSSSSSTSYGAPSWHGETVDYNSEPVYRTQTAEDQRRNTRREAAVAAAIADAEEENDFWAKFVAVSVILVVGITVGTLVISMGASGPGGGGRGGGMVRGDGTLRSRDGKERGVSSK